MLQNGFIFALGFLCAAALALMIAPPLWRLAVNLTRQRIESSVPLTLNEIQADKDQLRAEFAMSTRRLEVNLDRLKQSAAEQMIEIGRRRDEAKLLEEEHAALRTQIEELRGVSDELRSELREREERLSQTNKALSVTESRLEAKAVELEALERKYREAVDQLDDQKIDLVSKETRIDAMGDEVRDLKSQIKALKEERNHLREDNRHLGGENKRDKDRLDQAEKRVERLQSSLSDVEARLERRERDLARLRGQNAEEMEKATLAQTDTQDLAAENTRLSADLADAALRTEALLKDASGQNVENAIAVFEKERADLRRKLDAAEADREAMRIQLSAAELASSDDWETERRENAIVRERINDLAAKVTAMTALVEGPNSPINEHLAEELKDVDGIEKSDDPAAQVETLADRIRALQNAALTDDQKAHSGA